MTIVYGPEDVEHVGDVELLAAAMRLAARKSRAPRFVRVASAQFEMRPGSESEAVLIEAAASYTLGGAAPQYVDDALDGLCYSDRVLDALREFRHR